MGIRFVADKAHEAQRLGTVRACARTEAAHREAQFSPYYVSD